MYVYVNSEPGLFTVGFYDPSGKWHPESDWDSRDDAAKRVAWLNGANNEEPDNDYLAEYNHIREQAGLDPLGE